MKLPETVNVQEKFGLFTEHWQPKVIADLNGQQVKLVKISGGFEWHAHEHEDELFMVIKGVLQLKFRDGERVVNEGELIVVPRGVEHLPTAQTEETWIMMFEPASTLNTGNVVSGRTVTELQHL